MTKCRSRRVVLRVVCLGLMAFGLQSPSFAQLNSAQSELSPRMATFDNAEGETCFSLSLGSIDAGVQRPSDIIVFVDTSASQTGVYKQDSITVLQSFLSSLNSSDRVKVFAVDLDPVALNQEFTSPDSAEVLSTIDNLKERVALGSTDVIKMLKTAADGFEPADDRNRNVVYIGDGVSRAGLVTDKSLSKATRALVRNEIPFSSFAIGPDRNLELLAAIANHSGGNIIADVDQPSSLDNAARGLAATVHESVFWPASAELPENIASIYPQVCPPIRSDRDSVVFGKVTSRQPITLQLSGKLNGQDESIVREITPEASNIDFAFLPSLIDVASKNSGIRLPTVGSDGVREYARVLDHTADSMANLGVRALAMNDAKAAATFANAALERNPAGVRGQQVAMAARYRAQDNPFGDTPEPTSSSPFDEVVEAVEPADSNPFGAEAPEPAADAPFGGDTEAPAAGGSMTKDPLSDGSMTKEPMSDGSMTKDGSATKEDGSMTKEDGSTTKEPAEVDGDIFGSVAEADRALEQYNQVPPIVSDDISAPLQLGTPVEVRESDIDRILAQAREGGRKIIDKEIDRQKIVEQKIRKQVQYEITRAVGELRSSPAEAINRLKNMIEVVDQTSELDESALTDLRYSLESALNSARQQKLGFEAQEAESAKNKAIATSILRTADAYQREEEKFARLINQFNSLMKERNYISAAGVVETAYELAPNRPEPVAAQATARARVNYERSLRLLRMKEMSNLQMLHDTDLSNISFLDDRLITFPDAEVWLEKKKLRKKFQNARLTGSARDEAILDALELPTDNFEFVEQPFSDVQRELEDKYGINIKLDQSAIDDALTEEELITVRYRGIRLKNALRLMLADFNATYIVRDEVLKIISLSNVSDPENLVTDVYNVGDLVAPRFNPFAGLGGGGGFGGGGGRGGGGGGLGGGGGGRGGGGGAFCIQDGAVSTTSQVEAKNVSATRKKPSVIQLSSDAAPIEAWTDYFSRVHPSPADVRETVRSYIQAKRFDEIVGLIYGALQNDRVEPWMFEALGYAMKLSGKPKSEIERVFMSAMDFATSPADALDVAKYMMKSGMEKRGLEILLDVATLEPTSTEPYLLGLDVAKKTENKEALQWLTVGILSQEWPKNPQLARRAKNISTALLAELKASDAEAANEYAQAISEAKHRDCVVEISYTGDADLDLYIQEPGGTICSRLITRTTAGGVHFGDNASKGSNQSGKITEKYVLPKGFSGDYQLVIKRITGTVTSGKVNVDVRHHVNSDSETREARPVTIEGKGTIVNFTLANGRREDSLEEHTLKTLIDKQMIVGQQILAQQLAQGSSSTSSSEYFGGLVSGGGAGGEGGPILNPDNSNLFRGGVVGYSPEVEFFDISASLQVQHATTSDRLYVIVSLTPNFTDLTDVENFNALGDVNTAGGAGGGGGGF